MNNHTKQDMMKVIALLVFILVQLIFIPFAIIGFTIVAIKQLAVSKKLGVSSTAVSAIAARWKMNAYGMRKDPATEKLYRVLPNGSEIGLWLLLFPDYLRYKIHPAKEEAGKESLLNVSVSRTFFFDKLIDKQIDKVEQFVSMGAGYDNRSYGDLKRNDLKFFELDQLNTQTLKIESLKKAKIDFSHVTFIDVDFATENWYAKLENKGYDPNKKTIFLWEGVTLYISERDVRKTIKEIREHSCPGSILIADVYSKRLIARQGVKQTNEMFLFGLDFSNDYEEVLKRFIESENLKLGRFYFMGHNTPKGVIGVVFEVIL
ncbi:MAG: class I SAM-dependent methyltransferase [Mangrovibacterium sp.]